eukprot:m.283562 g.283562  ORF g.283562 m.283562 type:complete len:741 (+) comp17761_c0_seq4:123-2345(+)
MAEDLEEQLTEQLASVLSLGEDDDSYDVVPYMASMLASDEDMVQDKANFDETVQDLLTSYGVAEDDEACAELCSKVYLCVQGLVSPSGEPSSASADNEPLALLEAPVVMRDTTGQALTEEQDASVVDKLGRALCANSGDGLPQEVVVKNTTARARKAAKAQRELDEIRSWKMDEDDEDALGALDVYLKAIEGKARFVGDINLNDVALPQPKTTNNLLEGAQLRLVSGRRYGLIGRNGIGKSTLLKAIATYQLPHFPTNLKAIHVAQHIKSSDAKVLDYVIESDLELQRLIAREKAIRQQLEVAESSGQDTSEVQAELQTVYDRLNEMESYAAEGRAAEILKGLQFTADMIQAPVSSLSGGWRQRAGLAAALFVAPDLLCLDEPTNHLDFTSVLWLQDYLKTYTNTIIIVSHDRMFLNEVVTDIVFFSNKKLAYYKGDYDNFVKVRKEQYLAQKRAYEAQQMQRQHMQEYVDRFYNDKRSSAQAARVKQALSKKKALEKMEMLDDPDGDVDEDSLTLRFPEPGPVKKNTLIQATEISFGYSPERLIVRDVNCAINKNSRIAILGVNGAGKSTLLHLLLDQLEPTKGSVSRLGGVRTALFAQHHVQQLRLEVTPVEHLRSLFDDMSVQDCRNYLGTFGLRGMTATTQVGYLSGGQRSRLSLATLTRREPHLIILDEPTNHLDMETIDVLIEAVAAFKGAIVIVSHDQFFLSRVGKEFWSLADGRLNVYQDLDAAKKACYNSK